MVLALYHVAAPTLGFSLLMHAARGAHRLQTYQLRYYLILFYLLRTRNI